MRDVNAILGQVVADLLASSHLLAPDEVAGTLARRAEPLGVSAARIYLADLQVRDLKAAPGGASASPDVLPIDSTTAGLAFRTVTIQHDPAAREGAHHLWIPVIDGTERIGVLELSVRDDGPGMLDCYRALASLAGLMIVSKSSYGDSYARIRRSREMALQGEMVWAFLAPRTFATDQVLVAATLEPAYEVGGDAFDYAMFADHLHVSIFDAVGHDLAAGLLASVSIASCRSTRRAGGTLPEIVTGADHAIASEFGDNRFVTALVGDLDVATGQFSWIPCGHPPPLLIRDGRVIRELARRPQLPLGLAELDRMIRSRAQEPEAAGEIPVYSEQLEPGDRLLLYTDGIIEGRSADDQPFGVERLTEFFVRHDDTRIPAPETLRQLNRAIVDYQQGRLSDDATIVMVEWRPDRPGDQLIP
jgi:serine phosphatase RsbU (regulator of sigma subunit)